MISFLIVALSLCNFTYANDGEPTTVDSEVPSEISPETQSEEPTVKYVGQASQESARMASSKRWQNIAIAAGVTVIAITTVILVAKNHHKH